MNIHTILGLTLLCAALFSYPSFADDDDDNETAFEEAELFFELNNTDGDLGIHALIDGDPWKKLTIEDVNGRTILSIRVNGRLRRQGMTELFFESAEPTFDELSPEQFFRLFPEGEYEIEGITLEGEKLEGEVEISHIMPAPVGNVRISGVPAASDCDSDLPIVSSPIVMSWDPVTTYHPDLGKAGEVNIESYELVLETDDLNFAVELTPDVTVMDIPEAFTDLSDEFKFEIIAQDENGNRTAVESCFLVE